MMHPVRQLYHSTLRLQFPPIRFAFAYGSAVFQQYGRARGKMLDLIFAVDDPTHWHKENLARNWEHYSFMRCFGPSAITRLQRYPAGVYYNTMVPVGSQLVKYGVISVQDLCEDLRTWKWLYVSGRLHKPVLILELDEDGDISECLRMNLEAAALCAVLMFGEREFTSEELHTAIAALSFRGDFRMLVGEDRNKVRNIVKPHLTEFERLYKPHLEQLVEKTSAETMRGHGSIGRLVPEFRQQYIRRGMSLESSIASVVRASSIRQSAKGVLTAGARKTVVYSIDKVQKMVKSYFKP